MKIYLNAAHTPYSPGAVYGGRNEHEDVLSFSGKVKNSLLERGFDTEIFIGYDKPQSVNEDDVVIIFHRGTAYKNALTKGASVTVKEDASCGVQYEAFLLLEALCQASGFYYKGVHTVTPDYPHLFVERTGTDRSFLFELGFIESEEDNRLFSEYKEKTARALADRITEIYKEGKYETYP